MKANQKVRDAAKAAGIKQWEIAIHLGKPKAIMTAYNKINGIHCANSRELCTTIAREEWGFDGIIMTDWFTTADYGGSTPWLCAEAGNDLIMPGATADEENILQAVKDGLLSEESVRTCAGRLIALAAEFSK